MIAFIKQGFNKLMTLVVSAVKKLLTLATLFSFAALFVLFFVYLLTGRPFEALVCLAGVYTFIHLNKVL